MPYETVWHAVELLSTTTATVELWLRILRDSPKLNRRDAGAGQASSPRVRLLRNLQEWKLAPTDVTPEVRCHKIGSLAIAKGYLTRDEVLKILKIQRTSGGRFGEIAVGLRLLTPSQIAELLDVQRTKRGLTSAEIALAKLEITSGRPARAA